MSDVTEETAMYLGLRKVIKPDGSCYYRKDGEEASNVGEREAIYPKDIHLIASVLGLGAILLDLNNVDYTRGMMMTIAEKERCFWLLDGCKVTIGSITDGGAIGSKSSAPDPNLPEPAFLDRGDKHYETGIRKCINPACDNLVDLKKRKSGACSKACMSYECTYPACVTRAEVNCWPKATHPHRTKIAKEHWQYRKIK